MKKRLLALALCLVMVSSLLPVTAAAATKYHVKSGEIEADGVYWDGSAYRLKITDWKIVCDEGTISIKDENTQTHSDFTDVNWSIPDNPSKEGAQYVAVCNIGFLGREYGSLFWEENERPSFILRIPGYESVYYEIKGNRPTDDVLISLGFFLTKKHDHAWQFTQTDSTLTASCWKGDIDPLNLTLKADSVTLPTSPFNARLEGLEQFKKEVPSAVIGEFVYKYKGPDGWSVVAPTAANAKAGEYQVGVRISGLPNKEYGPVAMSLDDEVIPDGAGYADLFVQYTAVDPAVTAQTGDNRPIELMMVGVLVFSVLAAAAFVLDSKRRYQQ